MAETIAAIATAQAKGAIAIIRISGDGALNVAQSVFKSHRLCQNAREMCYGTFIVEDKIIDNGLGVYMKAPMTYTGEDTVELFCHGSLVVQREILSALCRNGARPAQPGEFTRRAFLNGKLELSQAEAVVDLIDSETVEGARNAAAQMEGYIGKKITYARDVLLDITSTFYAYVDYPDEEIEELERETCISKLCDISEVFDEMLRSTKQASLIKEGVSTALIGRPNAGKSSVLNALLGYDRSIVSDIPGTTRDTVEEKVKAGNVLLRLIDTAGLRTSDDTVEKIGIERSERAANGAQLILAVFDGSTELGCEDERVIELAKGKKAIAIVNKDDLGICIDLNKIKEAFGKYVCVVSARENSGMDTLKEAINNIFESHGIDANGEILTNIRHATAIERARDLVANAKETLMQGFTPDIAISDLESAINALGEITGQTASEQILNRIFERFCVGK